MLGRSHMSSAENCGVAGGETGERSGCEGEKSSVGKTRVDAESLEARHAKARIERRVRG